MMGVILPVGPWWHRVYNPTRWQRFKAYWRLDLELVCELSRGLAMDKDYHDYPDSLLAAPAHFYVHTCRRCGKNFVI